ncbi:MAG: TatD family hydrolase [Candidatus Paceibacterota bacterium]|jgi:TatD DNase family protein
MNYAFFDVHSHLHDKAFNDDREKVVHDMKAKGFGTITVGTGLKESRDAVALADAHENIFATIGLHPADNTLEEYDEEAFLKLAQHEKVVAIGECGLDYHYIETFFEKEKEEKGIRWNKEEEKERQKRIFEKQIDLALRVDKPLMLHGRPSKGTQDAYEDMLGVLENAKKKHGDKLIGNAHFFVGNLEIAQRFLDIGFTMSFSGVITFSHDYDDVVRFAPLDMIHAETDSPYATPSPFRGQRNTPLFVQEVVAKIAVLREEPFEEVRAKLLENANKMFGV